MTSSEDLIHQFGASAIPSDRIAQQLRASQLNRKAPGRADPRHRDGVVFPDLAPSFHIRTGDRIFTIGSCFAREIERNLPGFDLPIKSLAFTPAEVDGDPASMVNEYNSGCIAQRLRWALAGTDTSALTAAVWGKPGDEYDLLLSKGMRAGRDELMQRRRRIDATYAQLVGSDLLIVTLGLSEVWVDRELGLFLNRIPDWHHLRSNPQRYALLSLTPEQNHAALAPVLRQLLAAGLKRVLLTVSPVPMGSTFMAQDAVVANATSKASLRVAAMRLAQDFPGRIDYFPSYEIVASAGTAGFLDDLIHVRPQLVARIMEHFRNAYLKA